ncbi:hypothetical protein KY290_000505 [Solanum tuberosum]|uniref:Integrase core domain containing protein n=2 Tax=Solanum tuberosum TaxID=4113 RepID=A0ABQ7WJJ8_SOLTU|nr:hypothetical protein KY290_000505 [Solanum tuberosum]
MEDITGRATCRRPHLKITQAIYGPQLKFTGSITDRGSLHGPYLVFVSIVILWPFPMIDWVTTFLRKGVTMILHRGSTMGPRKKNANKPAPVTASQSEGHDDSEASGSEVQINVTPEDHSPRATRSLSRRAILQDFPPQSEEEGSSSENGENSGSQTDTAAGNQSADASGDSAESESGSQADTSTSPPVTTTEPETGVREETVKREDEEELTNDDTMVMYVNAQEPNPALRPQLIACYRSMWTVNMSKEFFDNGIVNKTGGFKNRAIIFETRVVVADVKAFSDIYRIF